MDYISFLAIIISFIGILIVVVISLSVFYTSQQTCRYSYSRYERLNKGKTNLMQSSQILDSNATSSNWSGYIAAKSFTQPVDDSSYITGTFIIPNLTSRDSSYNNNVSIWVGIDGAFSTDPTVQQLGIDLSYVNNKVQCYPWFELYPAYAYEIGGFPVKVGDSITVTVSLTSTKGSLSTYNMTMINNTERVQVTIPTSYTTSTNVKNQCVEWIVEAPSIGDSITPLSSFTPIIWTNCSATIGGPISTISKLNNLEIIMINNNRQIKAQPSSLNSSGNGFTVTWLNN
jgi:hypothetical protein